MDYRSSASRKVALLAITICCTFSGFRYTTAQLAPNPLFDSVTITAVVPLTPQNNPNTYPDTPPLPPGPINMVNTQDAAVFKGLAYPGSIISLLKNGTLVAQVPTSQNGKFEIHLKNLNEGTYSFSIRATDPEKLTSKLVTFTIYVSSGVTTVIDGIFIPPTITSDKIEVRKGEPIVFLGKAAPSSEVRLTFHSETELVKKTKANTSGGWMYTLDSNELELGDHETKARSYTSDDISVYSDTLTFRVSNSDRLRAKPGELVGFRKKCDLNSDNRVNLLDFSIMAFWYKRIGFPDKVDLNSDKQINLTDLSILAYCWTG